MLTRTNVEIVSNERNIENSNTEWTTTEKKLIGLSILIFWLVIVSGIVCYITFYEEEMSIERVAIANGLDDYANRSQATVKYIQKISSLTKTVLHSVKRPVTSLTVSHFISVAHTV